MRLFRPAAACAVVFVLAGCEQALRNEATLEPTPQPGVYRWRVLSNELFPADSPRAEAARRRQLGEVVSDNRICPDGFAVERRDQTLRIDNPVVPDVYDVFYTIRCIA